MYLTVLVLLRWLDLLRLLFLLVLHEELLPDSQTVWTVLLIVAIAPPIHDHLPLHDLLLFLEVVAVDLHTEVLDAIVIQVLHSLFLSRVCSRVRSLMMLLDSFLTLF